MDLKNKNINEIADELLEILQVSKDELASLLLSSPKVLNQLLAGSQGLATYSLSNKLVALYRIVEILQITYPSVDSSRYVDVLTNGRIDMGYDIDDTDEEEDGSTSLISIICTHPGDTDFDPLVKEAVESLT